MADPLSIAGLTLAVIDQVWKVSERTAELISNFRKFDNVGILDQTLYVCELLMEFKGHENS